MRFERQHGNGKKEIRAGSKDRRGEADQTAAAGDGDEK